MLSALLVTNAMPRRIHIDPSVMMNGCTRSPTTSTPLSAPAASPTATQTRNASSTALTPPMGAAARSARPMVTPDSAYTEPTDRSMPPEMMTMVAPTAMIAMKLASVAVWISV